MVKWESPFSISLNLQPVEHPQPSKADSVQHTRMPEKLCICTSKVEWTGIQRRDGTGGQQRQFLWSQTPIYGCWANSLRESNCIRGSSAHSCSLPGIAKLKSIGNWAVMATGPVMISSSLGGAYNSEPHLPSSIGAPVNLITLNTAEALENPPSSLCFPSLCGEEVFVVKEILPFQWPAWWHWQQQDINNLRVTRRWQFS